jgi:hypothetical protein
MRALRALAIGAVAFVGSCNDAGVRNPVIGAWADTRPSSYQAPALDGRNVWLMPQTVSPEPGLNTGLVTDQTGIGALGSSWLGPVPFGFAYNYLNITDRINGPTDGSYTTIGLGIRMATGGPAVEGTRAAIYAENVLADPTSASNRNRFWAGGGFVGRVSTNDHGTAERPRGAIFGGFSAALFDHGANARLANATAWEYGIAVPSGNNVAYKTLLQLASLPADAVHGKVESQIAFSGNTGSVGWKNALLLTDANGRQPLTTSGCVLCTSFAGNPTIEKGIDLSAYRLTGNAFASHGFFVTGDGYIHWPGQGILRKQLKKRDTTLEDIEGLSAKVSSGKTYSFSAKLFFDADTVGGVKFAVGGTAAEASIIYQITYVCNDSQSATRVVGRRHMSRWAEPGHVNCMAGYTEMNGTIAVSVGGTLTTQFAQRTASNTSSLLPGSTFTVNEF